MSALVSSTGARAEAFPEVKLPMPEQGSIISDSSRILAKSKLGFLLPNPALTSSGGSPTS